MRSNRTRPSKMHPVKTGATAWDGCHFGAFRPLAGRDRHRRRPGAAQPRRQGRRNARVRSGRSTGELAYDTVRDLHSPPDRHNRCWRIGIVLVGMVAYFLVAGVAPLPQVEFRRYRSLPNLPGASADTMATSVATRSNGRSTNIPGVTQMTSSSIAWHDDHRASVRPQSLHRRRRAGRSDRDQRRGQGYCRRTFLTADLQTMSIPRTLPSCRSRSPQTPCRVPRSTATPRTSSR